MNSFLFYDVETTGRNPAFDQIVQFAAIRTTPELEELATHEFKVRLRPDVVPSAGAFLTHRFAVSDLADGYSEYEAVRLIHGLVNEPGTVSVGFNSLKFDDQFLRFAFYRNLLPPYEHQWRNGCSRHDLLPVLLMYWLYRPDCLTWPQQSGRVSLKLEDLSAANELASGRAHDALSDVRASIAVARRLRADRAFWEECLGYFDKDEDRLRAYRLQPLSGLDGHFPAGLMIDMRFGYGSNCQAPVLLLGNSQPYKNQMLWLRLDAPALERLGVGDAANAPVVRKKVGETGFVRPAGELTLAKARRRQVGVNVQRLRQDPALLQAIADYHCHYRYPSLPEVDADAALYENGFFDDEQQAFCHDFHQASLPRKIRSVEALPEGLIRILAERLLCRTYPLAHRFPSYRSYLHQVSGLPGTVPLLDHRGRPPTTPALVLQEITQRRRQRDLDPTQVTLLAELEAYLTYHFCP